MRLSGWTAILLGAALLSGCDRGAGGDGGDARAATREEASKAASSGDARTLSRVGGELYVRGCVMCHGDGGRGTALGPSLVDEHRTHLFAGSAEEVARVVREGVPQVKDFPVPMPDRGDGTFTDDEVQAVAAYVVSLSRR